MVETFEQLQEDIKREQYLKVWHQSKHWIISGLILVVIATAIAVWWKRSVDQKIASEGNRYYQAEALLHQHDTSNALNQFSELYNEASSDYKALAGLRYASLLVEEVRKNEAVEIYNALINDPSTDVVYRDLSALLLSYLIVNNGTVETELATDVEAIILEQTSESKPFSPLAKELLAMYYLRNNNLELGASTLQELSYDFGIPDSIRNRAREVLATLEVAEWEENNAESIEEIDDLLQTN